MGPRGRPPRRPAARVGGPRGRDRSTQVGRPARVLLGHLHVPVVVNEVETANVLLVALEVTLEVHHVEEVVEHVGLEVVVLPRVGRQARARVHLDEPWLEGVVNHDVVPVQLEAVSVVYHHLLDGEERPEDHHLHSPEELVHHLAAELPHHVQLQAPDVPLAPGPGLVVLGGLLDRHVGQVHEVVGDVPRVRRVARVGEAGEPRAVEPHLQGREVGHQHVDSQVELLSADQVRVADVSLHDIGLGVVLLGLVLFAPRVLVVRPPLADLGKLCEEEDALPLRRADGLHDVDTPVGFELLHEHGVLARQHKCDGGEVVVLGLLRLRLPLQCALLPL
mmetsp:Transcript_23553/g.53129  ORF Transcript_23553/g.53129 Transcript_23553/m.53129 type:complete len:334 (+) Transcript_23553:384-1385(+)